MARKKNDNGVEEVVPYHFQLKLCGEEHREEVKQIMNEYGITWREIPNSRKFFCIGDPKYMLDVRLHQYAMTQDWTDI